MKIKRKHLRGGQTWRIKKEVAPLSNLFNAELKILNFGNLSRNHFIELGMHEEIIKVKYKNRSTWLPIKNFLGILNKGQWIQVTRGEQALDKLRR